MDSKILKILIVVISLGVVVLLANVFSSTNKNIKETEEECFTFDLEKGEITGYKEICGSEVKIPKKINGKEVKKIGNNAFREKGLTKVIIGEGIEEIGIGAFTNNEIETLELSKTIKTIKPLAFQNNKIKKLEIPESVTTIGFKSFNNNLVNKKQAFIYQRTEKGINEKVLIGYAGKERKKVKVPEEVEQIYLYAFSGCGIEEIELNDKLERIESGAFEDNKLTSIEIPRSVIIINQGAFTGNPNLKNIIVKGKNRIEEFSLFNVEELDTSVITFKGNITEA